MLSINWYSIFYWLCIADNLSNLLIGLGVLATIAATICAIVWGCASDSAYADVSIKTGMAAKKNFKLALWIAIPTWIFVVLIPSKRDCLMIIAGGTVGNFITSDSSSRAIPSDISRYLHMSLQKEIEDLNSETRAELGVETQKERLIRKAKDMSKEEIINMLQADENENSNK